MDIWLELFKLWLVGMFFSWLLNLLIDNPSEDKSVARWTFNIVAWPFAILILCVKGGLEHFSKHKKK